MRKAWQIALNLAGGPKVFHCEVLQRRGTRNMRLRVRGNEQLLLTCPPGLSLKSQQSFIHKQTEWIAACLEKAADAQTLVDYLQSNGRLASYEGSVAITIRGGSPRSRMNFDKPAQTLHFHMDERETVWERDFKYLLRRYAAAVLPARVQYWLGHYPLVKRPARISVRNQSSRWGSCSAKGTVSLNWRLVLLPQHLADYVILHELAHMREMNHSTRFWNHLRELDPLTDQHEQELSRIGGGIIIL